jgi:hypothetical protein
MSLILLEKSVLGDGSALLQWIILRIDHMSLRLSIGILKQHHLEILSWF